MAIRAPLRKTIEPTVQKFTRVTPLRRMSYSAAGEDRIVLAWLSTYYRLDPRKIRYCDIGANHPTKLSNTFLLYSMGATGVLVEPDSSLIKRLSNKRPSDVVLNVGIAFDHRRTAALRRLKDDVFNTFLPEQAATVVEASKNWQPYQRQHVVDEIDVPLVAANEVFETYFKSGIDFVSIDTEGVDLQILQSINLERFRPKMICIEGSSNSRKILEHAGYNFVAQTPDNFIFLLARDREAG